MKDRKTNILGDYEAIDTNVDRITGKPAASTKKGRVKVTTMMHPETKKRLAIMALDQGITSAELIDRILSAYLLKIDKKK